MGMVHFEQSNSNGTAANNLINNCSEKLLLKCKDDIMYSDIIWTFRKLLHIIIPVFQSLCFTYWLLKWWVSCLPTKIRSLQRRCQPLNSTEPLTEKQKAKAETLHTLNIPPTKFYAASPAGLYKTSAFRRRQWANQNSSDRPSLLQCRLNIFPE